MLTFRCHGCNARIKAPFELLGQDRPCPGCGTRLHIRPRHPQDSDPVLINDGLPVALEMMLQSRVLSRRRSATLPA
jgi:hypothetical protein